ncbi:fungal pheromone mating factor STE2 GPCR-domain-containing protein [Cadophora sp. MPI-SDFR-AT-0126]|nr:fungal pheromone mating factor STE2 GPCR-domain-containing protein [Leotiomycetes sp. MPI-SDFR-AT-0126]
MSSPTSFDHNSQSVTFLMRDGVTPVVVPISDIDDWFYYNTALCINYGSQLGACFVMLVVTAVLTKESKRRTPVYILNILSLVFGFLRALLLSLYSVSAWAEFYAYFAFDFGDVPRSAYATSVAGTVIPLLMTITVNMSLFLQAYTVCKAMQKKWVYLISFLSGLVFMLAVGFRFAQVVTNSLAIMSAGQYFHHAWITVGSLATETISIWYYSIIFTGKLLYTVYARKNLGFQKWSYIQILAAMGGCTMILPSGFAVLEYASPDDFPEAGTLALTMVALLLPLSSLWASMITTEANSSFNVSQLWGSRSSQDVSSLEQKTFSSMYSCPSAFSTERKGSAAPISPITIDTVIEQANTRRDSTELDLEMMGVRVDRSYSVHSGI